MTKLTRLFCAPAVAALTLFSGSAAATGSPGEEPSPAGPWPPADTNGRFLPVPEEFYAPYEVAACGTTVQVASGDARSIKYRSTHKEDGTIKVAYRGHTTVDISRPSDGAVIDELDVSGRFSERYAPDGLTLGVKARGPSIISAVEDVEIAALAQAGLPSFLYFESGKLAAEIVFSDAAQSSITSLTITHNSAESVRDICQMLDKTVADNCPQSTAGGKSGCLLPPRPTPQESARSAVEANTAVTTTCPPEVGNCQYQPTMYDIDGNGLYDPYVADTNGNGLLDQNIVAGLNSVLIWLFDTNENSVPEQYGGDSNADAIPDFWVQDLNEDLVLDQVVTDPAVHNTTPVVTGTGGTNIIIDHGNIPLSPPGLTTIGEVLLNPGARTPTDFCTFLNSAALIGTNYGCYYR